MSLTSVPMDFVLFGMTLLGVALFHRHTLGVAVTGLLIIVGYKLFLGDFDGVTGWAGLLGLLGHEGVTLFNLLGLLLGFALLSDHFEKSGIPALLPGFLPNDWKGGFVLLILVFFISSFLDNIAAAMIGGTMASVLYRRKLHVGFLAAIVAASNAGGSGSVVGDTTTTMMWIGGVAPLDVLNAYLGAFVALAVFGTIAAKQQQAFQPISKDQFPHARVHWERVCIVAIILISAVASNVFFNLKHPQVFDAFPVIGAAVWLAILLTAPWRKPNWNLLRASFKGSIFLLSLVLSASMMPVQHLPTPSWQSAFGLGFVSAVFDNIPLTALALQQGGYDWGFLAYAVGFGGSMIWFGSSAGVALASMYPEARSAGAWLRGGWHIVVAYVLGFVFLLLVSGWHPQPLRLKNQTASSVQSTNPVATGMPPNSIKL